MSMYPTERVTTVQPDGSLESHEVVVVPLHISLRIRFLLGIRDAVVVVAMGMIWLTEGLVHMTDLLTSRWIPKELRLESEKD